MKVVIRNIAKYHDDILLTHCFVCGGHGGHAADGLGAEHDAEEVAEAEQEVGEVEEDDAALGVEQHRGVQQEGHQREAGGQQAQARPHRDPNLQIFL